MEKKYKWSDKALANIRALRSTPEYKARCSGSNSSAWRGGISKNGWLHYDTYINKIPSNIEKRRSPINPYVLQTKCMHCAEWFSPIKHTTVQKIKGTKNWRFYCSSKCFLKYKKANPLPKKSITKKIIRPLIIKTHMSEQLEKYKQKLKSIKRKKIAENNRLLREEQKKRTQEIKIKKLLRISKLKINHPEIYEKYKNSNAGLWFEINRSENPINWRIQRIITFVKARSKKMGTLCDLDKQWFLKRSYKCEATDIPFDNSYEGTFIHMNPYAFSIDKIDPTKKYTKNNCRLVLTAFNSLKSYLTDQELYEILKIFVNTHLANS